MPFSLTKHAMQNFTEAMVHDDVHRHLSAPRTLQASWVTPRTAITQSTGMEVAQMTTRW